MLNLENYENDILDKNISYYKNANKYRGNEILNSMKESLDNFLINLRTKSTSNNLSNEEIENYYLSKSGMYNSINVDLISPYQKLLKQNHIKKNKSKRPASSKNLLNRINASVINNNSIYNKLNNNNSFYEKNTSEIRHNNSMLYNENHGINFMNKNLGINGNINNSINYNNKSNYSQNNYNIHSNSTKFFQNTKIDFPIKLINNNNNNYIKKSKNSLKIPRQNKSQSFHKVNNNRRNNKQYLNVLGNIKNFLLRMKKENNKNKMEIKNIYKYYNILSNQIQNKIEIFMKTFTGNLIEKQKDNNLYEELEEKNKIKDEELEEKNNKIFLMENDLNIKEEKIKKLMEKEIEYKQKISQFKKIMKDVKIALSNYDIMKEKQNEFKNILKKLNLSNEELNIKTKELNEQNEKMKKDIVLMKSKKKSISKENEKNKSLADLYKNNYDTIVKEKEDLKKENLKLTNEIQIIKINNDKMNNIKMNNNFKIQSNLKLKETINNLTKEKKELENKYKNLQNRIRSNSSTNIIKKKKFNNLVESKNKSFIIYSISKIKQQNTRINKKKKFNKLVIENKMNFSYKHNRNIKIKKQNGYDYMKDINDLKNQIEQKTKYIKILEKEKKDSNDSNNIQINKLKETVKTLQEKNQILSDENSNLKIPKKKEINKTDENENKDIENKKLKDIIDQLEKDKNKITQAKTVETSQLRIEISKLKMQIYNLTSELEKYKIKENEKDEFNIDDNEVHRLKI